MAKCRLGILTLLLNVALVGAVTWRAAPSTTFDAQTSNTETSTQTQSATPAPTVPAVIINGTTYEPPNLCGYVEYSSARPYTCQGANATCIWNSHNGLVGCGNPTSVDYYTSCVPWRHLQDCNSSCLADPSILRCSTPTPYCVTPIVGPHHNYSIFGCEATRVYGRYHVHLTYSGQTTTGHLPRLLGDDGILTYGTRAPKNKTSSSTSTSSSMTSDPLLIATISFSVTDESQPTGWRNGNWSGAPGNGSSGRNRWEKAQIRTEIIAGTVIGAFMFLLAIGLFLWFFFAWRRVKRERFKEESEPKDLRLQEMGRESVFASEASGSGVGSRTMSQRTVPRDLVMRERERGREEMRSPVSPVSEVGSGYMSRGTSTMEVYDEIYDDEEEGRGRNVPLVVVSEAPLDEAENEIHDDDDACHPGGGRLEVPTLGLLEYPNDVPAEKEAEECTDLLADTSISTLGLSEYPEDSQIERSEKENREHSPEESTAGLADTSRVAAGLSERPETSAVGKTGKEKSESSPEESTEWLAGMSSEPEPESEPCEAIEVPPLEGETTTSVEGNPPAL